MNRSDIIKELSNRIYGHESDSAIKQCTKFCDTLVEIFYAPTAHPLGLWSW